MKNEEKLGKNGKNRLKIKENAKILAKENFQKQGTHLKRGTLTPLVPPIIPRIIFQIKIRKSEHCQCVTTWQKHKWKNSLHMIVLSPLFPFALLLFFWGGGEEGLGRAGEEEMGFRKWLESSLWVNDTDYGTDPATFKLQIHVNDL